jgi:hypothetical protein
VNVIELPLESAVDPFSVTDHDVPEGRPVSVNVTEYSPAGIGVNVIARVTPAPFTGTSPEDGEAVYPDFVPTVKVPVPFGSLNVIELPVVLPVEPFSVTDHAVPDGRPVSVNVTV